VISQRLVRRVCGYCRESYRPSAEEYAFLDSIAPGSYDDEFARGTGCNFCAHTGYLDRVGVYEMMPVSERIRELIVERASTDEIRKVARTAGMQTLLEEAARLVRSGVTTTAEVMRSVYVTGV
jgi:type IV pilus assembly protein PilB